MKAVKTVIIQIIWLDVCPDFRDLQNLSELDLTTGFY